jgi:hypothetical protein
MKLKLGERCDYLFWIVGCKRSEGYPKVGG